AAALGVDAADLAAAATRLFGEGFDPLAPLTASPAYPSSAFLDEEDFARTIHAMGTSLLTWARALLDRGLFADDARVFGLTSEGNTVAWKGYAAVGAAKVVLESIARAMAVELAPYGVRSNIIQAGVTDTPALRAIPGHDQLAAQEATLYTHAEAGRRAAEMALERAGMHAADVGMVIAGSSVMDTATPAEACNIARALGIEAPALDVNSACTSFFAHLHLVSLMRPEALPPFVLLVVSEAVTRAVDYTDRGSAVLWGDGSVAAVVSTRVPGRARILATTLASSPEGADPVVVPRTGHLRQDGRA